MRIKPSLALILLAAVISLPARAVAGGQDKPADVAGTWNLTVDFGGQTGTPSVTLKQDGETLTGTYSSEVFGEQKVTGTIKGNAITFGFTGAIEGNSVKVTYTGTVDKSTMKGKVTLGDVAEGTFTAAKQQ
jgi:hypothetical protein